VHRVSNSDVEEGVVFQQSPTEGTKVDKETVVRIDVSSGKPEVQIPSVVGQTVEDAVAELTRAGLDAQVVEVNSDKDQGTVTAQSPAAGTVVVEGTQVRINVSKGPKPVNVPNVVGLPYDQAATELQRAGFNINRIDEESDQAAGIVISQTPSGGSEGSKNSTVTVTVSKGPTTSAVPDVTSQDYAIAQTSLEQAGFRSKIVFEDTEDQTLDGIVISQDPVGGSQQKPNTIVTLFVGRYVAPTTTTTPTP
jgi:eukaryotic-like serine/threonine-protein kinase